MECTVSTFEALASGDAELQIQITGSTTWFFITIMCIMSGLQILWQCPFANTNHRLSPLRFFITIMSIMSGFQILWRCRVANTNHRLSPLRFFIWIKPLKLRFRFSSGLNILWRCKVANTNHRLSPLRFFIWFQPLKLPLQVAPNKKSRPFRRDLCLLWSRQDSNLRPPA